ncbi:hypothetical protein O0I10_011902 [Lichtheimia ornata]|uniref:Mini-chromosome maintenance complex-binding protein n=1 Tax=Lichtheimia ornata TaxID=688661 RepID=A0AAD7USJ0_9FUNG|nr:uncharacterized protein O0I10_011902 [Lichtheimia ornata]KAJ8652435.1 hypothetical protein O0I10_011902 [Lichtheimia ornata]
MSCSITEAIKEPLKVIDTLFADYIQDPAATPNAFDPSQTFADLFANEEARSQIPSINNTPVKQLPKNTLVRFRCMVQDTGLGQEMFVSAYKDQDKVMCYRYTEDPVDVNFDIHDIPSDYLSERTLVYCVSPPGETQWLKRRLYKEKEGLESAMDQLHISQQDQQQQQPQHKKYPLPNTPHVSAAVKFYASADSLRVGQLVDVIGVLGHHEAPEEGSMQHDAIEQAGFDASHLSLENIPVVHAITFRSLDEGSKKKAFDSQQDLPHHDIRAKLIDYLSTVLGGDKLAAEFLLLSLVSRVTAKNRGVKIGHFTLNLVNFPDTAAAKQSASNMYAPQNNATKLLASLLETLVHHCVALPLSIDLLNKSNFSPKSVNENLEAGMLQLTNGTVVLVDETALTEGKLGDTGVRNVQALSNIINHQSLSYIFPYSQFDFDTDLVVLTLSHGKSMLPNHCTLRIEPQYNLDELPPMDEDMLDYFRMYIEDLRHAEYEIPEQVSEYIQTTFVNGRKTASANGTPLPSQDDLMLRVSLARMVSLSFGERVLSKESYDHAMRLDTSRKARTGTQTTGEK